MEIDNLSDLSKLPLTEDLNIIQKFMKDLPEKAFNFGTRILLALIVLFIGVELIKLARKIIKKALGKANVETGVIQFLDSLVKTLLYIVLFITIASGFGLDAASVIAVLGSAGVALGLALQGSLSNLAGGVLILVLKPFKVGDYIIEDGKGHEGIVTEIQIFYTKLCTPDHKIIILPNGALSDSGITNISMLPERRLELEIGISYNANIKVAKDAVMKILQKDQATIKNNDEHPLEVFVISLGDSSVNLGVRCWVMNEDYWDTKWRIQEAIKLALDEAGVEIPFPQIDVHMQK